MFRAKFELVVCKLEYLIDMMERLVPERIDGRVRVVCANNRIIVEVPPVIMSDDLNLELEFLDDERDLYEYIVLGLITSLYDKGIVVGDNNVISNYFMHPWVDIVINDEWLWDLVGEIVIAKRECQSEEIDYLINEKRKCIKRKIRKRVDTNYLMDLDDGIGNIETVLRGE